MEEKHRSVKNLRTDTSKANPGSQKAVPVNAWLLAQGSYKRPKPLLIKPQQAKLQQSWQASKTSMQAAKCEGCQLESTQRNYYGAVVEGYVSNLANRTGEPSYGVDRSTQVHL